jgi:hypothetical protein
MPCQKCGSERVANIGGKCSDMAHVSIPSEDYDHHGYMPDLPSIGSGDYIDVLICLDCGQTQGSFPIETPRDDE